MRVTDQIKRYVSVSILAKSKKMASEGASDKDVVKSAYCTPCSTKLQMVSFQHYCLDCEAYFCNACFELHPRVPFLAKHLVLDRDEALEWSGLQYKCPIHRNKFEYFCKKHDCLCCHSCIILQHRSCDEVEFISECTKSQLTTEKRKSLLERIEADLEKVHQFTARLREKNVTNRRSKDGFLATLRELRQRVEYVFDQLEEEATKSMEVKFNFNSNIICQKEKVVQEIAADLEIFKRKLETCWKRKDELLFICIMEGHIFAEGVEHRIGSIDLTKSREDFKLEVSDKVEHFLQTVSTLGKVTDGNTDQKLILCKNIPESAQNITEQGDIDLGTEEYFVRKNEQCEPKTEVGPSNKGDVVVVLNTVGEDISQRNTIQDKEVSSYVHGKRVIVDNDEEAAEQKKETEQQEAEQKKKEQKKKEEEQKKKEAEQKEIEQKKEIELKKEAKQKEIYQRKNDIEQKKEAKQKKKEIEQKKEEKQKEIDQKKNDTEQKKKEAEQKKKEIEQKKEEKQKEIDQKKNDIEQEMKEADQEQKETEQKKQTEQKKKEQEMKQEEVNSEEIQLFIKNESDGSVLVSAKPTDTIAEVKRKIKKKIGDKKFELEYGLKTLEENDCVQFLNLHNFSTLHIRFNKPVS